MNISHDTITRRTLMALDANARPLNILYLDDDDIDRVMMKLLFKNKKHKRHSLICVRTLEEARAILEEGDVDIFITDNRMPEVTNFRDTLACLHDVIMDAKIIVVSDDVTRSCFYGLDALLHQPDAVIGSVRQGGGKSVMA